MYLNVFTVDHPAREGSKLYIKSFVQKLRAVCHYIYAEERTGSRYEKRDQDDPPAPVFDLYGADDNLNDRQDQIYDGAIKYDHTGKGIIAVVIEIKACVLKRKKPDQC